MSIGLLFDATRCIGCGACAAGCKEANELPLPIETRTTAYTWTIVEPRAGLNVRRMCMHCLEPACASVCPVAALVRTPEGAVAYDARKCIGCRYCIMACPFDVPKYQWDRAVPIVGKCTFCIERVRQGGQPACAQVCPTGATTFGERDALLAEARRRIRAQPGGYVEHVYGTTEAGGTGVLMLSSVAFESLGLKTDLPRKPLPLLTWEVLSQVPDFAVLAGALLYGVYWITERREEVREAASERERPATASGEPERGEGQR